MQTQMTMYDRAPDAGKLAKSKQAVLNLLEDGLWHSSGEIVTAGGLSALRRLRELREEGRDIQGEPIKGLCQWRYRLV